MRREDWCREILQELFPGHVFETIRPEWLMNPETGRALELDMFDPTLGIAVEHNGEQHYHYPNIFHKTKEEFIQQVRRDQYKKRKCDQHKVTLIVVPYNIDFKEIKDYIVKKLTVANKSNLLNKNNTV